MESGQSFFVVLATLAVGFAYSLRDGMVNGYVVQIFLA